MGGKGGHSSKRQSQPTAIFLTCTFNKTPVAVFLTKMRLILSNYFSDHVEHTAR